MLNRLTYLKIVLLLVLALGFSGVALAEALPAVVALFGDSITVGYIPPGNPDVFEDRIANGTTTRGLPTQLLDQLLNDGQPERPAIITNWGYGGTSSGLGNNGDQHHGLARINSALVTAMNTHVGSPYLVLIMYGANDFGVGIDPATTRNNIETMIDTARSRGFTPIIGNLVPRSDRDLASYNSAIASAASNKSAPLVDHSSTFLSYPGGWQQLFNLEESVTKPGQYVRLHPKKIGYEIIADNWFNQQLKNLVATAAPRAPFGAISLLLLDDDPTPP